MDDRVLGEESRRPNARIAREANGGAVIAPKQ
jgi:hypothetical protein